MRRLALLRRWLAAAVLVAAATSAQAVETDASEKVASDPDVVAARKAHDRRDWKEAVARLQRAERRFPEDADLQNSLGYAFRQLKDYDAAFKHYGKALQLDPRHRGAHEYIGEAYLLVDDLPSAEKHLASLRRICLLTCQEMRELEKAITEYKARRASR